MPNYLIFDTETTGQPVPGMPSEHPYHPRVIQLAAELCDEDGNTQQKMCMLINPTWGTLNQLVMDPAAEAVHGISFERIIKHGLPPKVVLGTFYALFAKADATVCHSAWFDQKMMKIEKAHTNFGPWITNLPSNCTMRLWQKRFGGPVKKLTHVYEAMFGRPHDNAHTADADVKATKEIFFELKRSGQLDVHIVPRLVHPADRAPLPLPGSVPGEDYHKPVDDPQT